MEETRFLAKIFQLAASGYGPPLRSHAHRWFGVCGEQRHPMRLVSVGWLGARPGLLSMAGVVAKLVKESERNYSLDTH